jgi:hypothetical protein
VARDEGGGVDENAVEVERMMRIADNPTVSGGTWSTAQPLVKRW